MKRVLTGLLAALALSAGVPAGVAAAPPSGDLTAAALTAAYKAFPEGECVGKARVEWVRDLDEWAFAKWGPIGSALGIYSGSTPCVLYIAARVGSWRLACTVIVHEFGHSAGYGHDHTGHHGVMGKAPWPGCGEFPTRQPNANGWNHILRGREVRRAVRKWTGVPDRRMRCQPMTAKRAGFGVVWVCDIYRASDRRRRGETMAAWTVKWDVPKGRVVVGRP